MKAMANLNFMSDEGKPGGVSKIVKSGSRKEVKKVLKNGILIQECGSATIELD